MVYAIAVEFMHAAATKLKHHQFLLLISVGFLYNHARNHGTTYIYEHTLLYVLTEKRHIKAPYPILQWVVLGGASSFGLPAAVPLQTRNVYTDGAFFPYKGKAERVIFSTEMIRHAIDNPNEPIPAVLEIPSKKTTPMML